MDDIDIEEMNSNERDELLGASGTGVLSLTTDEPAPYSRPVSYGYDQTESVFYFRLALSSDSVKGDLAGRVVSFVTYGQVETGWRSVIATGALEETTDESTGIEALQGLERTHIPLIDIFGKPPKEVSFGFYRLVPTEFTTRKEGKTEL
ncbi:pyridoxamine 5'-phosphate oxidase family protein [Halococcus hamelinensis]|uniref:Flavin-nucleotide-binding protein-like protein n=1 Tax=Halococcus hamelinensis 100A6 TaxID=1132509 RepID=M0M9Q6_9EURY|nr:pyridoxamine 5'-phosphate oxidase family protein [Halococcus hamelinensis]EMA42063.1 hypothetical protein C447_00695 [Halococcus hamelinensis 100A6]